MCGGELSEVELDFGSSSEWSELRRVIGLFFKVGRDHELVNKYVSNVLVTVKAANIDAIRAKFSEELDGLNDLELCFVLVVVVEWCKNYLYANLITDGNIGECIEIFFRNQMRLTAGYVRSLARGKSESGVGCVERV